MNQNIELTPGDVKALIAAGGSFTIETFSTIPDNIKPTDSVFINMENTDLGHGPVIDRGEAVRRTVKRLGRRRRFWSRKSLTQQVWDLLGVPPGITEKTARATMNRQLKTMMEKGELLGVHLSQ